MRILLLLALLFGGCEARAAATPLSLAYPAEGTIVSGQVGLVLERTDILKRHGFEPKVVSMGTGRELKTALVSGKADVIMTSETNFVVLLGNGFDCYAVNSLGSAGRMALVTKAASPLSTVASLKGRKIATIFGTSIHQPALEWIEEAGLKGKAEVIDIPSMGALQSSLVAGTVDGIMAWDPFLESMIESGNYRVLKQAEFVLITVASKKFRDNSDAVSRLNSAMREAVAYLGGHKAEVNGWFSRQSRLSVETIDRASRANHNYNAQPASDVDLSIPAPLRQRLARSAEFLYGAKFVSAVPDISGHIVAPQR